MVNIILDVSGIVYRCFHGIPPIYTTTGIQKNALVGFYRRLISLINQYPDGTFLACFDTYRHTNLRRENDPEYKANRKKTPEGLHEQFEHVRNLCDALQVQKLYIEGYEADDLIANICKYSKDDCIVVTYDKDMLQLIKYPHVKIYNPQKKLMLDEAYVKEKYNISSEYFDLYLALVGDSADNVKGVRNIGPKRASALINNTNGDIDSICSCIKIEKNYLLSQLSLVRFLECNVYYESKRIQKEKVFLDFLIKYEMA
tara:strand:- start:8086 stop:8856 length:771 start_codon:yes stop_codon:yes gene_type:complete